MSRLVTVSRKMVKGAEIKVRVHHERDADGDLEIGAAVALDDFLAALADVINPALIATRAQLRTRLITAAAVVLTEMKAQTVHVA